MWKSFRNFSTLSFSLDKDISVENEKYLYDFQDFAKENTRVETVNLPKNPYEFGTFRSRSKSRHIFDTPHSMGCSLIMSDIVEQFLNGYNVAPYLKYPVRCNYRKECRSGLSLYFFNDTILTKLRMESCVWLIKDFKARPYGSEFSHLYEILESQEFDDAHDRKVRFKSIEAIKKFKILVSGDLYCKLTSLVQVAFNDPNFYEMDFLNFGIGANNFYISPRLEDAIKKEGFCDFNTFDPYFEVVK